METIALVLSVAAFVVVYIDRRRGETGISNSQKVVFLVSLAIILGGLTYLNLNPASNPLITDIVIYSALVVSLIAFAIWVLRFIISRRNNS